MASSFRQTPESVVALVQIQWTACSGFWTLVATKTGQIRAKSRQLDLFVSPFTKSIGVPLANPGARCGPGSRLEHLCLIWRRVL